MTNTYIQDPAMAQHDTPEPNAARPPVTSPSTPGNPTTSNKFNTESQKTVNKSVAPNKTPLAEQVIKMKELLVVNDTANTFSKSFRLLFLLLKEAAVLVWLALCWGVVALSWIGDGAKQIGPKLQIVWTSLKALGQRESKVELATGTMQNAIQTLVVKAKKQVGVSE